MPTDRTRRIRIRRGLIFLVSFFVLLSVLLWTDLGAWAEVAGDAVRVAFRVNPFQTLSLGSGPAGRTLSAAVTVPRPTAQDLSRGYVELPGALKLQVRSNVPWTVKVRTDDPDMGTSFDGTFTKPISDLQVRVAGGPYLTLSRQDQVLAEGPWGTFAFEVDYRVLFDPQTHRDGDYRVNVIYTLSTR